MILYQTAQRAINRWPHMRQILAFWRQKSFFWKKKIQFRKSENGSKQFVLHKANNKILNIDRKKAAFDKVPFSEKKGIPTRGK